MGDALGAPVEFLSLDQIRRKFGPGGIQELAPAYGRIGAITDDTQMTLFTAEGLLRARCRFEGRGICHPASVLHHAYVRWLHTQGLASRAWRNAEFDGWLVGVPALHERRSPGRTCLAALQSAEMGTIESSLNDSKGCGGVMRAAPMGLMPIDSVRPGCWESRKAIRILSIKNLPASRLHTVPLVGPRNQPPARLPPMVAVRTQSAAPAPAPIPLRLSALIPKQKRVAPKGPAPQAVAVAIRKAERKVGARWQLAGSGHDRRVTLRGWYSRAARRVTTCWQRFHPHEAAGWLILWPLAVVLLAAKILRTQPATLIGREY